MRTPMLSLPSPSQSPTMGTESRLPYLMLYWAVPVAGLLDRWKMPVVGS